MEFDESKVCTQWSDKLEGKKGWFSDYINIHSKDEGCLRNYVKTNNQRFYGICYKGGNVLPFIVGNAEKIGSGWKYFYPDDEENKNMEFDKKNIFIAGYNDDEVNIGDEGLFFDNLSVLPRYIKEYAKNNKKYVPDIIISMDKYTFYSKNTGGWRMFYRTKCAPKKHYIPWTKENFPLKCGDVVKWKNSGYQVMIVAQNKNEERVWIGSVEVCAISFDDLFKFYELPDGSPCGQEVTE